MLLDFTKNKLKIVNCDYYQRKAGNSSYNSSQVGPNPNLASLLRVYECNSDDRDYIGDDVSYNSPLRYGTLNGIYLGDNEDFQTVIANKIATNLTGVKKIYFDPASKYPRFKLNELTSIKRCLSPSKADVCVLPKVNIPTYKPFHSSTKNTNPYKSIVQIYYSKSEDAYYLIDHCPEYCYAKQNTLDLQKFINNAATSGTTGIDKFVSAILNEKIIPSDCTLFYKGKICILSEKSEFELVNNILNNYMKIIYDTELDKFINCNLQDLTDDDLKSLTGMLKSSDPTVVGMGIKLISSYNIVNSSCSVGILIASSWNNITNNSACKSVAFKQVLKTLSLEERDLYSGNMLRIINKLYQISTDEKDREKARKLVLLNIESEINQKLEHYKKSLDAIPIDFDFTTK